MLAIAVELLTGRYVATAYNARQASEWPPHPARLFSALAATHFAADAPSSEERAALEWLEAQASPAIAASAASSREVVTVYVPVNDAGMTNVDAEAEALDAARAARAKAVAGGDRRAERSAASAERQAAKRYAAAVAREAGAPKADANPLPGLRVLPEHRVRQPRTFPSMTPSDPRVTYVWPDAQPTPAQRRAIDGLLARLVRLGHSSSLVAARVVDQPAAPVWRPAADGEVVVRTVQPGQLAALEQQFALHRETEPRLMPARFELYTRRDPSAERELPASLFSDDWLVLRRVGGPALPMQAAAGVARALRRALMSHATAIPEVLSGHTADGRPSEHPHLAIVPLPFVGHRHASGTLLGVALVMPRAASDDERRAAFAAVAAWEDAARREDEDAPALPLHLGAAGELELERVEWVTVPASLRAATWCRPARAWSSVTPVALDQNPGDLRAHEPARLAKAVAEAEASLRLACRRIGLPEPSRVEVLPASPVAGAAKSRAYPPFPEEAGRVRRVLTHARLVFAQPVRGPVLLGAGRFLGLGLFRPESDDA